MAPKPNGRQNRSSGVEPYRRLLVPLDGSKLSESALPHAMMLAVAFSSELVLFRVIERVRLGAELAGHEGPDVARRLQDEAVKSEEQKLGAARRYLLRHARTAGEAGINVTTSQVVGSPVDAILDYCRDNDVDLVVMTTRGRSGLKRLILGSVAEAVVRSPVVPVLVISGAK